MSPRPTTAELKPDQRELLEALREGVRADVKQHPVKVWAPWVAVAVGLIAILGWVKGIGDEHYLTKAKAATIMAADRAEHIVIKETHVEDLAQIISGLQDEIRLRALQGKDVEANGKDIQRLERRLSRFAH